VASLSSLFAGIQNPVASWKFQTQGPIRGGLVADDESIYFGSSDGYVYKVNKATGQLTWKFATGGAITNSPALTSGVLLVSSRSNIVYALHPKNGQLLWKFQTQPAAKFEMEWDYHAATPVVVGKTVYVGAADSYLYALSLDGGKELWKFKTGGRIRATPLVDKGKVYLAGLDGFVYVLDALKGTLQWKFETEGAKLDGKKFGYDRTSIYSSPRLADSLLVFGSRDGSVYCVNVNTQKKKWSFFYDGTWAMSEPVIENNVVYIGWSTNFVFSAIDLTTGKELWKYKANGVNYGTPVIEGGFVYTASADHNLSCLEKTSGKPVWSYKASNSIYSSPLLDGNAIYVGDDNGALVCLREGDRAMRAVYHPVPKNALHESVYGLDKKVTNYFKAEGFEQLDSAKLYRFFTDRIRDGKPSVVVFGFQYIPDNILGADPAKGLMHQYLEAGGKVLWFGDVPKRYLTNDKGQIYKVDNTVGNSLLGVNVDHAMESGNYYCTSTQEGLNWGLPVWHSATYGTVAPEGIEVLATNEFNRPAVWVKKFVNKPGTGFVSYRPWAWFAPFPDDCLPVLKKVALYGLE
jgi:outer membrane protein assembly factor BamB